MLCQPEKPQVRQEGQGLEEPQARLWASRISGSNDTQSCNHLSSGLGKAGDVI